MIKVENSVTINRPLEVVFQYVTDADSSAKWQNGVEAVEYEGEQKVGSQYTEVRKFMGREMRTTLEITAMETNQLWAAKTLSGPVPYHVHVTFEAVPEGAKMTTVVEAEPKGFFKLAESAVKKQLENSMEEDNQTLKALLEAA